MKCICSELEELQKYKKEIQTILIMKEIDLVSLGRLNRALGEANVRLVQENRELKQRLEERNGT